MDLSETPLRPYQLEIAQAIAASANDGRGLTFSVEIAREGGKNEISSYLELFLLTTSMASAKNLIKCSPTFKPQTVISMQRLKDKLHWAGYSRLVIPELGYIIRLGKARAIFLSAGDNASVVGNTAHLLLEVDEAQDVSEDKYTRDFKPMGSTTNVTSVLYGTTWDDSTLLEKIKQNNLELERKDGIKRHFRYDWQDVARFNPAYQAYVETEKLRLGEDHPLFLTQYRLLPVQGGGGFFNRTQKAQLQGQHSRLRRPAGNLPPRFYIAGIDLAGEAETDESGVFQSKQPALDSTVVTIGEMEFLKSLDLPLPSATLPYVRIVEHYAWRGRKHHELYPCLVDLLKNVWHCRSIVVDSTGIGQPVASFLRSALGARVFPFDFTAQSKSELGFNLLAAVNSGRLKMYAADNSPEYREFWLEMEKARSHYRASRTMGFYVDPADGRDDYLMSLALLVEASGRYSPREARGS